MDKLVVRYIANCEEFLFRTRLDSDFIYIPSIGSLVEIADKTYKVVKVVHKFKDFYEEEFKIHCEEE